MATIKCKKCGGAIDRPVDNASAECPYCGSYTTFPKIADERRAQLYDRAEHFRRIGDFDKAISTYETLLAEDNTDPEVYWGIVLSRYGIEYVEEPVSHERVPTCHRVQFEPILADPDYQSVLKHSVGKNREIYENDASRIADLQKGILSISAQEEPFDVFICYKETTEGGSRTEDSSIAQDIHYQLTNEGYRVFFSRITLEEKLGQQYEPYIFAALNSAKVMLVVGTKKEYFNAAWVKNEWSRYLALMKKDRSRLLIPCYKSIDAYDIPEELSLLQSLDMNKIGFIQDLLRGIDKITKKGQSAVKSMGGAASASSDIVMLMKRVQQFLDNKQWESANKYCERILDKEPENSQAHLCKVLAANKRKSLTDLHTAFDDLESSTDLVNAIRFADESQKLKYLACIEMQKQAKLSSPPPYVFNLKTRQMYKFINGDDINVQRIADATDTKIEINRDNNSVTVFALNENSMNNAIREIDTVTAEPEVGQIYQCTVVDTDKTSATVAFMHAWRGWVHISELPDFRNPKKVDDICKNGDKMWVKCLAVGDDFAQLSVKTALAEMIQKDDKRLSQDSFSQKFVRLSIEKSLSDISLSNANIQKELELLQKEKNKLSVVGKLFGEGILGALGGAIIGVIVGALAGAFMGSITMSQGAIIGTKVGAALFALAAGLIGMSEEKSRIKALDSKIDQKRSKLVESEANITTLKSKLEGYQR